MEDDETLPWARRFPLGKIQVGTKVMMELAGMKGRLQSFFVGYITKRCIITMFPIVPEMNRSLLLEHLYKGNTMTVRYIHSGTVLGFTVPIMHVSFTPVPLLFLEYPERIESFNLRKDGRVSCLFPAYVVQDVQDAGVYSGALSDISKSGCSITLPMEKNRVVSVEIDDHLTLRCPLLFASEQAEIVCMVKRINKNSTKVELGLKLIEAPDELLARITSYIEQTIVFVDAD